MADPNQLWTPTNTPFPSFAPLTNSTSPSPGWFTLPALPSLPSLGDLSKYVPNPIADLTPGGGLPNPAADVSAAGSAIVGAGGRYVTIAVGLLFLFGGLYILGTSGLADAIKSVTK